MISLFLRREETVKTPRLLSHLLSFEMRRMGFWVFSCPEQLYTLPCQSVGWSVGWLVCWLVHVNVEIVTLDDLR